MPLTTPTSSPVIIKEDDQDVQTTLWTKLAIEKDRQEKVRKKYLGTGDTGTASTQSRRRSSESIRTIGIVNEDTNATSRSPTDRRADRTSLKGNEKSHQRKTINAPKKSGRKGSIETNKADQTRLIGEPRSSFSSSVVIEAKRKSGVDTMRAEEQQVDSVGIKNEERVDQESAMSVPQLKDPESANGTEASPIEDEPPKQRVKAKPRPSLDDFPQDTSQSSQAVWGSRRVVKDEDVQERECWVYFVAAFLIVTTTLVFMCVVFLVFGAAGEQVDYKEALFNTVAYLSPDQSVFDDPSSPESLALDWLANEDGAQVDRNDRLRIENRYSLAVLFYATDGTSQWINSLNFLSADNECLWNAGRKGVFCEEQNTVTSVIIDANNLRGIMPPELSALSSLKILNFTDNRLTGSIPSYRYSYLENFLVPVNNLEGRIPESFGEMTQMVHLDLSVNSLTSQVPTGITKLSRLESFLVGNNNLSGNVGSDLQSIPTLRYLNVTSNSFVGNLDLLGALSSLSVLDLSFNVFSGRLPENSIAAMTNIESIVLSQNSIVGPIPTTIGSLPRLSDLRIARNLLTGTFPWSSFAANSPLSILDFSNNVLTGQFPGDIFRFPALRVIDFSKNHLTGVIPLGISALTALEVMLCTGNKLTGGLPASIGNLQSMRILDLSDNELAGLLPDALGNLQQITFLDVHGNQFGGTLPPSMGDLTTINRLAIQDNEITGNINFLCLIPSKPLISADCDGDPPKVRCDCCDICVQ